MAWLQLLLLLVESHSLDTEGDIDCPCVNPWDSLGGIPPNLTHVTPEGRTCLTFGSARDSFCYDLDYGSSRCRAWDQHSQPGCATSVIEPPESCTAMWCYVDNMNCGLQADASILYNGLHYSYQTCGARNTFVMEQRIQRSLKGTVLRVGVPAHAYPWLDKKSKGKLTGITPDFLSEIALKTGFGIDYREISNKSIRLYPNSSYTACIQDVAFRRLDLCVSTFWQTPARSALASFSPPYGADNFLLIVFGKDTSGSADILDMLSWVFKPLSSLLWLLVLIWSLVVGIALWLMSEIDVPGPVHGVILGMQLALLRMMGQGSWAKPRHAGFGVVATGFGFLCVCVSSAYRANLAASRAIATVQTDIASLDDVLRQKTRLCVDAVVKDSFLASYPQFANLLVEVGRYTEAVERMDDSTCGAALLTEAEAKLIFSGEAGDNCNKVRVGGSVLTVPLSAPVADRVYDAFTYMMSKAKASGSLDHLERVYPFGEPICKHSSRLKDKLVPITPTDMAGALTISAVLIAFGFFLHVIDPYLWKICQRAIAKSKKTTAPVASNQHQSHEGSSHEDVAIHTSGGSEDIAGSDSRLDYHAIILQEVSKIRDDVTWLRESSVLSASLPEEI
eukprot:TRINITY_DN28750_c0_g1_i1.p1 TRINITY_DN28750_c0_g1~~TRINITY_DN28750_c0_g1_i1.p1  ORF type:complete len:619 (+),score=44.37 TRINITY_DN28750_c0_g1_i1:49-1905(+)